MAAGVTDHIWELDELLAAILLIAVRQTDDDY
jgi:hypothetical protein